MSHKVLLIDCEDSFVHTLAGYFRMSGSQVNTRRIGFSLADFKNDIAGTKPDLVCFSPGPGSPSDFGLSALIEETRNQKLPIFGVCLGLQAIVEHFGGTLSQLETPMHGKISQIDLVGDGGKLFAGISPTFNAGRYHSLYADRDTLPAELKVTATTHLDNVIMGIEHISEPIAAVQFHPESIMTFEDSVGRRIVDNACKNLH